MPTRFRGWLKLVLLTFSVDQILSAVFSFAAERIDPDMAEFQTVIFSCVTCVLVSHWLVTDARAAWTLAKKQGYIGSPQSGSGAHAEKLAIANNCPRRWLVVLHLELNPQLGGSI
ncbi:MAG TPA: hypothetical protein VMJ11_14515 [Paraburkholderia sp.]|uniref:hypothetical protein n=1 Tax=Paraburkholderia sp. TaxID=1926495 RepID=UPI002B67F9FF|nr:hypothetical protein [Paraburkholderia sp.]HTR07831.1 hypothetical protein [Paraburkholderia sp.]